MFQWLRCLLGKHDFVYMGKYVCDSYVLLYYRCQCGLEQTKIDPNSISWFVGI